MKIGTLSVVMAFLGIADPSQAAFKPEKIHPVNSKKLNVYVRDGLMVGGDRTTQEVVIRDIRRASNAGFERLVIDLEGSRDGEQTQVERPPYFQVAVNMDAHRVVFSVWGNPRLGFDARKIAQALKRSPVIQGVELLPKLEEDHWMFALTLKGARSVEVFELSHPARIIADIKTGPNPKQ